MISKTVIIDGVTIHYYICGQRSNPPLVLLHSFHTNACSFTGLAIFLSKLFRVYVPDLPGFGKSSEPTPPHTLSYVAQYMLRFIKKLDLKGVYLCGISMGGAVALDMLSKKNNFKGVIFLLPLFDGRHLRLTAPQRKKTQFILQIAIMPILGNFLTTWILKSPKLLQFIMTFARGRPLQSLELKMILQKLQVCTPQTYVWTLRSILSYQPPALHIPSQLKSVLIINPHDDLIDPAQTIVGYKKTFPGIKVIHLPLHSHNPGELPSEGEIQKQFPSLISDLKNILF